VSTLVVFAVTRGGADVVESVIRSTCSCVAMSGVVVNTDGRTDSLCDELKEEFISQIVHARTDIEDAYMMLAEKLEVRLCLHGALPTFWSRCCARLCSLGLQPV
jgi:hypothetical protein